MSLTKAIQYIRSMWRYRHDKEKVAHLWGGVKHELRKGVLGGSE